LDPLLYRNGQPRESPHREGIQNPTRPALEPEFVEMTPQQEGRAIEALAELLAPPFLDEPTRKAEGERQATISFPSA